MADLRPDPHDPKDLSLIRAMGADPAVRAAWQRAFDLIAPYRYAYHWTWLGRPAIQFPQDLVAIQEIIWRVRPEVVVETGIAHGGSLVFSASMLALLGGDREAIGIDIDIRSHNRAAIEAHPLAGRIVMFEGSSVDDAIAERVRARVAGRRTLVILDANHTAAHVARELELYAPLVGAGSYCIVLDTAIETADPATLGERPWGPGNNPMTAVDAFLAREPRFSVDDEYDNKLLFTVAPRGYLRARSDPGGAPAQAPPDALPITAIRAPRDGDADLLGALRNDLPTQYALLATPRPNSREDVLRWIERRTGDPAALFYTIADEADAAVGFVQIVAIDPQSRHGTFGIALAPAARGKGRGRAALALALDAARADGRLDKLVLHVAADNLAARRLYVAAGFREAGALRRHYRAPDGWHDVAIMERFLDAPDAP